MDSILRCKHRSLLTENKLNFSLKWIENLNWIRKNNGNMFQSVSGLMKTMNVQIMDLLEIRKLRKYLAKIDGILNSSTL